MGMKADNEFVRRMFAMTAKQHEDSLSFNEFLTVLRQFVNAPQKEKLQTLFKMCDLDGSNRVLRKDLAKLVKGLNQTAGVHINEGMQLQLFNEVLHSSGVSNDAKYLTYDDFNALFADIPDNQPVGLPFNRRNFQPSIGE